MGFIFLYLLIMVLGLWMVVRVWRGSALLGICCLLIPGVVLFALIKNWGDPDTDIKVPFFLSALLGVFMFYFAADLLGSGDPQLGYVGLEPGSDDYYSALVADNLSESQMDDAVAKRGQAVNGPSERWEAPASVATNDEDVQVDPAVQRRRDKRATAGVLRQSGPIQLGPAYARLQTPAHFRFVAASRLKPAARLHGRRLPDHLLGWVVHERVSLAEERAWFAEISFKPVGHLQAAGIDNSAQLQQAVSALGANIGSSGMFAAQWSQSQAMLTWTRNVPGSAAVEAVAARPLRHGVLSYVVRVDSANERELALRTARLMASETVIGEGWRFMDAPVDTPAKGPSLAQWVAGTVLEAAPGSG